MTGRRVTLWWMVMLLAALGCGKGSSPTKPDNRRPFYQFHPHCSI
jgi:hypothetical protein